MQFFSTVCMAAIASALFRMLIPENRFAKQISLLTAGLFILAGVNALRGTDFDMGAVQYSYEDSCGLHRIFRRRKQGASEENML